MNNVEVQSSLHRPGMAISVQGITKIYKLYDTPMERLKESLHPLRRKYHKDFYALDKISFEISKGETVGIIGRNGSGKSTLLKIITGVLTPTDGLVKVDGNVSALLELGAGFNPELTGIENVYFNGILLGYSKEEMHSKLDDILAFADIGDFARQPVKIYSSGMFVRLAFAVAINVDPEILIIDEALSVGDVKYQRKCYSKLEEFREKNKTILFVSHDMSSIGNLCNSVILLDAGKLIQQDVPRIVSKTYLQLIYGEQLVDDNIVYNQKATLPESSCTSMLEECDKAKNVAYKLKVLEKIGATSKSSTCELRHGNGKAEILDFGILDQNKNRVNYLKSGEEYTIFFYLLFYCDMQNVFTCFAVRDVKGADIFYTNTDIMQIKITNQKKYDVIMVSVDITNNMAPGNYFLSCIALDNEHSEYLDRRLDVYNFTVSSFNVKSKGFVDLKPAMQWSEYRI